MKMSMIWKVNKSNCIDAANYEVDDKDWIIMDLSAAELDHELINEGFGKK